MEQVQFEQNGERYVYTPTVGTLENSSTGTRYVLYRCPGAQTAGNSECKIKFLSLHVAHECPLYCEYCYGDGGAYDTPDFPRMSWETAKQSIDYLFRHCSKDPVLHINFFGGEPLLAFALIQECVQYSGSLANIHGKQMEYSVSTSGLLMTDEMIDFLSKYNFSVSLSIDATEAGHDRHRKFRDGSPSYSLAVDGFTRLAAHGVKTLITATLTHYTYCEIQRYDELLRIGANNFRFKSVTGKSSDLQLTPDDYTVLAGSYEILARRYLEDIETGNIYDFGDFTKWLHRFVRGKPTRFNCSATEDYINVDPKGEIYICHKFVGIPAGRLGSVYDLDTPLKPLGFDVGKSKCSQCWAHTICSGGCYFDGYEKTENPYHTFQTNKCKIHQAQIRAALYLYDNYR